MKNKTWVITGASSGLGLEVTKYLIKQNNNVIAFSRNPQVIEKEIGEANNLLAINADLNSIDDIKEKLDLGLKKFDSIDILLNNAGYGMFGPFEDISHQEIMNQFNVNVFYCFNTIKAVLPIFRQQKYGHIFNTSSIAGFKGHSFVSVYSAVKFALDGFSEALNEELNSFNISVSSILPGVFRTSFLEEKSLKYAKSEIDDYQSSFQTYQEKLKQGNHQQLGNPQEYAKFIYKLTEKDKLPVHIFVGADAIKNAEDKLKSMEQEINSYKKESEETGFKDFKGIL